MAIKASGSSLSFSEIETEFGNNSSKNNNNRSLGGYRISETYGDYTTTLDSGLPSSGQIKFSDFYSKRLNIVVDFHSGSSVTRVNAKDKYGESDGANVVGGWVTKPSNTSGKKVVAHVNKIIGSNKFAVTRCALRTGTWDSDTTLQVDVGTSGEIYGAGGNGGDSSAGGGNNGSSAVGFEYSGTLINRGYIQCGFGGGGAGGTGYDDPDKNKQDHSSTGGGGGGGAGFPNGSGGRGGTGAFGAGSNGAAGSNSTNTVRGSGGGGGSGGGSVGGRGGAGGDPNNAAQSGGKGQGNQQAQGGGGPGSSGAAVRRSSGVSVSISNSGSGTIHGATDAFGVT